MRLKTWLLTGTSIGLMAFAPLSVVAQDADLQAAYRAYVDAQASGDAAALEAAQANFTELCIVGGFSSIDECIAVLQGGGQPAAEPQPEVAPEPAVEEPAPEPVVEEPAPEPVAEEPAPEPVAEEPAPEPVVEEPAPEPVMEEPAPEVVEEQAAPEPVAEEPAPAVEEAPVEEPGIQQVEEPVAEQPQPEAAPAEAAPEDTGIQAVPEEAAPAEETGIQAVPEEAAPAATDVDYASLLAEHVAAYEQAIADMMSGGDAADAQARMDVARAEIEALCAQYGQSDINACLAEFGLSLPVVPGIEQPAAPTTDDPQVVPPEGAAPGDNQPAPLEEITTDGEMAEPIVDLPEGVTEEQIAPVLDSAKDAEVAPASDGPMVVQDEDRIEGDAAVEGEATAEQAPAEARVMPTNDAEAQTLAVESLAFEPLAVEAQGTEIVASESATVNQTVINNYITNITNNVTGDGNTVVNGVEQAPVTVVEAPEVETSNGDIIAQVILQVGTQLFINSVGQDTDRFYNAQEDEIYYEQLDNNRYREVITRPDGTQIVTIRNANGDVLRRSRFTPDGREYVLSYFDDQYYDRVAEWRDPAADLPPLRLNIPVQEYVLDSRYADENELQTFFAQPPVEQVARLYSIDEVKRSARLRDSVRRLEVGNLTFDTAAATIGRDQVGSLSSVAAAMLALLETNPSETFLIEGHTDAVGSDISNLRLSDLRAATVARVLTDFYGVPPENLATQGYGERYLKVRTEADERENRRVTIRRITPLITVASN